jgi:uncharacterized membrane-anchored protein YhcB (DUF1043 family)
LPVWQTPFTLSIFWWLLAALVIGVALGALYGGWLNVRYRFANRRLRKALDKAQQQLAAQKANHSENA